jgi:plastocyanin
MALLTTSACRRTPASAPAAVAGTPTPLDPATTGTVSGRVFFDGEVPAPRPIAIASDPTCVAAHPAGLALSDVREQDGQLADVFVYIAHGLEDRVFAVPDTPVVVDQRDCLYTPRVVGAQVGQPIAFVNSDDTLHNVHGEPTASAPWNFGLGVQGARRTITIDHAEVPVPVRCDVHPWMHAALAVVAHPYYAVTNTTGIFSLAQLPAGHYFVAAWHPTLGAQQAEVDITAGHTTELAIVFTPQG